jgi:hypothetical protein
MNEKSVLQVQIYDRSIEEEMFLGFVEIRPKLVNNHTVDQWFSCVLFLVSFPFFLLAGKPELIAEFLLNAQSRRSTRRRP